LLLCGTDEETAKALTQRTQRKSTEKGGEEKSKREEILWTLEFQFEKKFFVYSVAFLCVLCVKSFLARESATHHCSRPAKLRTVNATR
jgi:hypothetical protein